GVGGSFIRFRPRSNRCSGGFWRPVFDAAGDARGGNERPPRRLGGWALPVPLLAAVRRRGLPRDRDASASVRGTPRSHVARGRGTLEDRQRGRGRTLPRGTGGPPPACRRSWRAHRALGRLRGDRHGDRGLPRALEPVYRIRAPNALVASSTASRPVAF